MYLEVVVADIAVAVVVAIAYYMWADFSLRAQLLAQQWTM